MDEIELEDWSGIEVVQVKALELRKLHNLLTSYKKKVYDLEQKLQEYSGIGKTPHEWNQLKTALAAAQSHASYNVKQLEAANSALKSEVTKTNRLAKENDALKVKLYDINTQLGVEL